MWEHTGSNRGPSACKADALNQLSYAPFFGSANIRDVPYSKKFKSPGNFKESIFAIEIYNNLVLLIVFLKLDSISKTVAVQNFKMYA